MPSECLKDAPFRGFFVYEPPAQGPRPESAAGSNTAQLAMQHEAARPGRARHELDNGAADYIRRLAGSACPA